MKKIVLFISLVFSVCGMRAQDTINPFTLNPATLPVLRDSAYRLHLNLAGNDSAYPSRYISCNAHIFDSFSWVTGLNIAMSFRDNLLNDSVEVRGILIKIHDKDYEHPEYHFTRPVISNSRRPLDRYMTFDNPGCICPTDTVLPVYSLYFEEPIEVSDILVSDKNKEQSSENAKLLMYRPNDSGETAINKSKPHTQNSNSN